MEIFDDYNDGKNDTDKWKKYVKIGNLWKNCGINYGKIVKKKLYKKLCKNRFKNWGNSFANIILNFQELWKKIEKSSMLIIVNKLCKNC